MYELCKASMYDIKGIANVQSICFPKSFYVSMGVFSPILLHSHIESFIHCHPNLFYVANIAVLPEFLGKGVADELITSFINASSKMNLKSTMLCVSKSNERAIAFYKKHGYSLFTELGENDIIMHIEFKKKRSTIYMLTFEILIAERSFYRVRIHKRGI